MKDFFKGMIDKPQIVKRFVVCLIAVIIMGICVSWLALVGWGTDPCSAMNIAVSGKLSITFGNYQAILNTILFILVLIFGKENIGFGTVLNMFVIGYTCDAMNWIREKLWPGLTLDTVGEKALVMVIALTIFVVAASIYMTVDLGTAPYDAICVIIHNAQKKLPFQIVRMLFDGTAVLIAFFVSGRLGIVSVAMVITLGPMIQWMGKRVERWFFRGSKETTT